MILTAIANLLALYSEKLAEEITYLPEEALDAALVAVAGAVFFIFVTAAVRH